MLSLGSLRERNNQLEWAERKPIIKPERSFFTGISSSALAVIGPRETSPLNSFVVGFFVVNSKTEEVRPSYSMGILPL